MLFLCQPNLSILTVLCCSLFEQEMAERMNKMRRLLVSNLEKHCTFREWSFLSGQSGMFAYTGLDAKVCKELMRSYHVYLLLTGRISLSGLTEKKCRVCG
uniref:Aminotransferase class I/classII large domain-containing protein n=1 Tax=Palpitomonas bilix TaxID=652834 RepID=A0A7S3D2D8_9EUKA|mmetsp:Transcript_19270/g.49384  ORF Transcript_19270/g.49384 Transcript_19270/m.49384 type:complete len:100 (+) Transcript_19270:1406-1705(+)